MDMYQENILEHYENPQNFGEISNPTVSVEDSNPLCGDKLGVHILIDDKEIIKDIKFHGHGCAISMAAMSMLTEKLLGKNINYIKDLSKDDILEMLGIPISMTRIKCALLSLKISKLGFIEYHKDK
jgi:nitrogen fixation protein NifU and related proteins